MNSHTGTFIRPTLQEVIQGWPSIGFTKHEAIRAIMKLRLRQGQSKGNGNKAARREALAFSPQPQEWDEASLSDFERMIDADMAADRDTEARIYRQRLNSHE